MKSMSRLSKELVNNLLCLLVLVCMLVYADIAVADSVVVVDNSMAEQLNLISGKSKIMRSSFPIDRVSLGNPEIADFILLSAREI